MHPCNKRCLISIVKIISKGRRLLFLPGQLHNIVSYSYVATVDEYMYVAMMVSGTCAVCMLPCHLATYVLWSMWQ